jgi:hypothetical protein
MTDLILAAPQASYAGIATSVASIITALTVLVGAIVGGFKVIMPLLRETRRNTAQLGVIHTLVNSTLTAALQAELDATRREEMLLRELMGMRADSGQPISEGQRAALSQIRVKIESLTQAMSDRMAQTRAADIQIQTERDREARMG